MIPVMVQWQDEENGDTEYGKSVHPDGYGTEDSGDDPDYESEIEPKFQPFSQDILNAHYKAANLLRSLAKVTKAPKGDEGIKRKEEKCCQRLDEINAFIRSKVAEDARPLPNDGQIDYRTMRTFWERHIQPNARNIENDKAAQK